MGHVPEEPEGVHGCGSGGGGAGGAEARPLGFGGLEQQLQMRRVMAERIRGEVGGRPPGQEETRREVAPSWAGVDRACTVGTTWQ